MCPGTNEHKFDTTRTTSTTLTFLIRRKLTFLFVRNFHSDRESIFFPFPYVVCGLAQGGSEEKF